MKRNVIALALCTVLAISVVGCSSNNTENKNIASDNSKIAIEDTEYFVKEHGQKIIVETK